MHSLRTRITLMTVCVVVVAAAIITLLSVLFIKKTERNKSDQTLLLLCEIGERNIDYYFSSVEKSVKRTSSYVEDDLEGVEDEQLKRHMDRVEKYFEQMAYKTNGVLTYYYRIDPAVSESVKGFWYTNLDGEGFQPHEVTDITLYDTNDTSSLVWFTVPKFTGKSIWLPPYVTDNLDVRVISYNVPIYWQGQFVGVVGIEIDYSTMAEQVESIRLYSNGYAFITDAEGNLIFHPRIDVTRLARETTIPKPPEGMLSSSTFYSYTFEGVEKQAAWLTLCNGMRLNVSVPVSEMEGDWHSLIREIVIVSAEVLIVLTIFILLYTKQITKHLEKLTAATEQVVQGNYDFVLDYNGNDEVGKLTKTFKRMADHTREHISDLNKRAYVDALTSVRNKGAYTEYIEDLQKRLENDDPFEFAMAMFDCNNLKQINDQYGHDKGDLYLKSACQLICRTFHHSPVFRIGGDEFAAVLLNDDLYNKEALVKQFEDARKEICASARHKWEEVNVAMGIAAYDPQADATVIDTVRRADKMMYENKRNQKEKA